MGKKILVLVAVGSIMLLFVPIAAFADAVSWDTGTYRAYAYAKAYEYDYIYDESAEENFSQASTLPISASAYAYTWNGEDGIYSQDVYGDASSSISDSSFDVSVSALSW